MDKEEVAVPADAADETQEVAEETKGTEEVAEETAETPQEEPPAKKKKETVQERIDEITRKRREAEREAEYWRMKALHKDEPPVVSQPPPPPIPEGRPKVTDFETVEQYEDALLNWHEARRARELTLAEHNKKREETVKQFNEKANALRVAHDDYDEVINAPIFTHMMKQVLLSSENGPGLAYYLGKNRAIADRIANLPMEVQAYELGKLETQYLVAQKAKKVTSAPEPIVPGGGTGMTTQIDESKLSDDDWFKLEKKRRLEKLKKLKGG